MTPLIKRYYLMQLAYWVQQLLVLALRLEKPRKDFVELVIHHIVTIWLVGWSYITNMTWIGNGGRYISTASAPVTLRRKPGDNCRDAFYFQYS